MKLKEGFVLHTVGEEHMVVATGELAKQFNGLVRNNGTANFIFEQLLKETSEDAIVEAMLAKYNAPRERIEEDVKKVLGQLRNASFLDE